MPKRANETCLLSGKPIRDEDSVVKIQGGVAAVDPELGDLDLTRKKTVGYALVEEWLVLMGTPQFQIEEKKHDYVA